VKIYTVGGALRDELLGLPVSDRDYVVVGATPEEMVKLGYKPVGRDFPVFLHPQTHEEYALARTERKTVRGYHGFEFYTASDVTLEQDLARRDLTINAIARDDGGHIIDPFGGVADLKARLLRHVGAAFVEDPVRILRVARFAARFDFAIAPETLRLMRQMVADGEVDALVAERVWQELARGLMEPRPQRMLQVLHECGALARVMLELEPEWSRAEADSVPRALALVAQANEPLEVRFAVLMRQLDPLAVQALCNRLKVPADCADLGMLASRHTNTLLDAAELDPASVLGLFNTADLWRKPQRFEQLAAAAFAGETDVAPARERLRRAQAAVATVDAGAIARATQGSAAIRGGINAARLEAIRRAVAES
jgi:tRNA nucleotidyltransferase (CCA-adding enzyme)